MKTVAVFMITLLSLFPYGLYRHNADRHHRYPRGRTDHVPDLAAYTGYERIEDRGRHPDRISAMDCGQSVENGVAEYDPGTDDRGRRDRADRGVPTRNPAVPVVARNAVFTPKKYAFRQVVQIAPVDRPGVGMDRSDRECLCGYGRFEDRRTDCDRAQHQSRSVD